MEIFRGTVSSDAFTMDYFRFGSGKDVFVILPGLSVQSVMGAADAVAEAYRGLTGDFTVYLFDRRADIPPVYTVADMARDTAEAFRSLGLREVCLFGASQGGMIAMTIAMEHPELVRRLALGSTSAHIREPQHRILEKWISLAERGDREGLYLSFGEEIYPPEVFRQVRGSLTAAASSVTEEDLRRFVVMAEGMKGFDVVSRLRDIRCPVLVIGVYEDAVLDSDATMEIAEKLDERPDFRLYMYIGYGHAAYDTAPDYRERLHRFFLGRPEITKAACENP